MLLSLIRIHKWILFIVFPKAFLPSFMNFIFVKGYGKPYFTFVWEFSYALNKIPQEGTSLGDIEK